MESLIAWMLLLYFIELLFDINATHPILLFVFTVFFSASMIIINMKKSYSFVAYNSIKGLRSAIKVEIYSLILIEMVSNISELARMALGIFINLHNTECKSDFCPCRSFLNYKGYPESNPVIQNDKQLCELTPKNTITKKSFIINLKKISRSDTKAINDRVLKNDMNNIAAINYNLSLEPMQSSQITR